MIAPAQPDAGVERLKKARDNPAVLKLQLIQMRGRCPGVPILVVEGVEDKAIYSQWVRRLRSDLRYEYHVCGGKRQVLALYDSARRDVSGLAEKVYFLIDRDFDDYAGAEPGPALFMTEKYSTENYLVDEVVLDDILRIELHCNGSPEVRDRVTALFREVYSRFLIETREINFRLFLSKSVPIPRTGSFPERVNQIAVVGLDKIEPQIRTPVEVVALAREPTPTEVASMRPAFDSLEAKDRYRGKFALMFFHRWLDLLSDDYASKATGYFSEIEEKARARRNEIVLTSLASRSTMPAGLAEFVGQM